MFDSIKRLLNHPDAVGVRQSSRRRSQGRRFHTELLEQRELLSADFRFIKDINPNLTPDSSNPREFVAIGSTTFFVADTDLGEELWKTDGTAAGTKLVKDINDGGSSSPSKLTIFNGLLYFQANGGANGNGLWKSDGTSSGTVFVKNVGMSSVGINVGGALFFAGSDNRGTELWKSDGTSAGTVMVKDIDSGEHYEFDFIMGLPQRFPVANSSNPAEFTNIGGTLYFTATGGGVGRELWKSDGTETGTVVVKDIIPGTHQEYEYGSYGTGTGYFKDVPNSSSPSDLINVNGTLYFTATDGSMGKEVWRSDGTSDGTLIVEDVRPGIDSSNPSSLTNVDGVLFFSADDGLSGAELWMSDGTNGVSEVVDIRNGSDGSAPRNLINVNGALYFSADNGVSGSELWKWSSNGANQGLTLVSDLRTGSYGSYPENLINIGGILYFSADDGLSGRELWKRTSLGATLVKDMNPGGFGSDPHRLVNINGKLYFSASGGSSGDELCICDGTTSGTILINIEPEDGVGSQPTEFANAGGNLYFTANDGTNGSELWSSDGTSNGTVLVKNIRDGSESSNPRNLTAVDDIVFFAANDGVNGTELWKTNGTAAGTSLVRNIRSGTEDSYPSNLTNVAGVLYFTANDGTNGVELWKSDGTTAGTVMVKNIVGGSGTADPVHLANHKGVLYFTANGTEIWKSNGTAAGTVLVKAIGSRGTAKATGPGGVLYFLANADSAGSAQELWKTDGTSAGTVRVKNWGEEQPYNANTSRRLIGVGNTLYFTAYTSTGGEELWKSDGTESGTVLVKDIYDGKSFDYGGLGSLPNSSRPDSVTNVSGTLYFVASDGSNGRDVWRTDGTAPGTVKVKEATGSSSSIHAVGNGLYASLYSEEYGDELYTNLPIRLSPTGTAGDDVFTLRYRRVGTTFEVEVTLSTNGGPMATLGTFSTDLPLSLDGLGGSDSVRVLGTTSNDTIIVNSSTGLMVNGVSLILTSIENRSLAAGAGNDVYTFDADSPLGTWTLDESGGGTDTVDLSRSTTVSLSLNLAIAGIQFVHNTNLSVILGSTATIENVTGGSASDTLTGNSLDNSLKGGAGDDKLIGAAGNDALYGGKGDDSTVGGSGNDRYFFDGVDGTESDWVTEDYNAGIDTLDFGSLTLPLTIILNSTITQSIHAARKLRLNNGSAIENVIGGSANDILVGNSLPNKLEGGSGNDHLNGDNGDDIIDGETGADSLYGGSGGDKLYGRADNDDLYGGSGDDRLYGGSGSDTLRGETDSDVYYFERAFAFEADLVRDERGQGEDTFDFSTAESFIKVSLNSGEVQNVHPNRTLRFIVDNLLDLENLVGGAGNDTLTGNSANNGLFGGGGNDGLIGDRGNDVLDGGAGDDLYLFGSSGSGTESDRIKDQSGVDTIDFTALFSPVQIDLSTSSSQVTNRDKNLRIARTLRVSGTLENAYGGHANDRITGNSLSNTLRGNGGHDTLIGGSGSDSLSGGDGDDDLNGQMGIDTLWGDEGHDILISIDGSSSDTVTGGSGRDTLWIDKIGRSRDSLGSITSLDLVQEVAAFRNGADTTLNGDQIRDPDGVTDSTETVAGKEIKIKIGRFREDFSQFPLYSSAGPKITDINQQALGDCYFLAGLGAIVRDNRSRIKQYIVDFNDGTYGVRLGNYFYRVDGELPVRNSPLSLVGQNQRPIYASLGAENCLWVAIAEKAFAHHRRNASTYRSIESGNADEVNRAFSAPSYGRKYFWQYITPTAMANDVFRRWQNREALCIGFDGDEKKKQAANGVPVILAHAYTVTKVLKYVSGKVISIELRNPWGVDGDSVHPIVDDDDVPNDQEDGLVRLTPTELWRLRMKGDVTWGKV